ncbi:MAG: wax ester/triacylglycerol synthase family O-acyltransferase [Proteobacteria bacterium]|nr:wax ester/triacylglycerol synthase family O-acyltransferase [Pseudomonadota bacterium]
MNSKLSGQDALFLNVDLPHAASHGMMIYIYEQTALGGKPLGFRQIVRHVESRLDASPVLRRRIVQVPFGLGYPFWVDDDLFDIDFHVRHFALPKPGDWRQFCIMASRIHARSVDLTRSPWEMYVIEGLDNIEGIAPGSFAILTKIHHAAMDGTAAAELTWALHDIEHAAGKVRPVVKVKRPAPARPTTWKLSDTLTRAVADNLMATARMAPPLARLLPRLAATGLRSLLSPRKATAAGIAPRTRFNADVAASRVWDSVTLDLAAVKGIKSVVPGATVNDAVIAMIGGAMRRYLQGNNELPPKSLVTLAPVNTRQEGANRDAAGNTISVLRFPLCTDIEDPIERLAAVRAATAESKGLQNAIGARDLTDVQKFIPPATLGLAGRLSTLLGAGGKGPMPLHNCLVTNVPGPNLPLRMLGAELVYWVGVGPVTDGMSLIWNATSYCGKMFISLTSAPNIVPDPEVLAQCLKDSYAEMVAAAAAVAKRAEAPGKAARRPEEAQPVKAVKTAKAKRAPKATKPTARAKPAAAVKPATRRAAPAPAPALAATPASKRTPTRTRTRTRRAPAAPAGNAD